MDGLSRIRQRVARYKLRYRRWRSGRVGSFCHPTVGTPRIAVLYYVPLSSPKSKTWEDGFTKALEYLQSDYGVQVTYINLADWAGGDFAAQFDYILVKSNWGAFPDEWVRKHLRRCRKPIGLMISGSLPPPRYTPFFYDHLWFETFWYERNLLSALHHPSVSHAFGVDTSTIAEAAAGACRYDFISVGALTQWKNHLHLLAHMGKRLVIGEDFYPDSARIKAELLAGGVEVLPYTNYAEYAALLKQASSLLIASELQGGGERALLEARAAGLRIVSSGLNPKLAELAVGPIWDSSYYARTLHAAMVPPSASHGAHPVKATANCMPGKACFQNGGLRISGDGALYLGNYCSLGNGVTFILENHDYRFPATQGWFYKTLFGSLHPGEAMGENPFRQKGPITIGSDVWLGDRVTVLPGVTVGHGCCVGAGSVVAHDLPPYTVCAGVPARVLKHRFPVETSHKLLQSRWWTWSADKIQRNWQFFHSNLHALPDAPFVL